MNYLRVSVTALTIAFLSFSSLSSFAGVFVSVNFAPPPLPIYEQPACPDDGYIWTPGYWAYGEFGYYWVPGVWVQPPGFGLLWTPGYWGWNGGSCFFHSGYWGPHVGFYGGINYGFGYGGRGYGGGRWEGGHFAYNSAVNNINSANIHNTYIDRTTINNNTTRNVSFNGGNGGVQARPTSQEQQFAHQQHTPPTSVQQSHVRAASQDRNQLAKVNGGRPTTLASARPEAYNRVAQDHAATHPLTQAERVKPQTGGGNKPGKTESQPHPISENATHDARPAQPKEPKHQAVHNSGGGGNHAAPHQEHHPAPASHPQHHAAGASHPQHQAKSHH